MNNHKHLLEIVIKKEEDYEPFGKVIRWENENEIQIVLWVVSII